MVTDDAHNHKTSRAIVYQRALLTEKDFRYKKYEEMLRIYGDI